MFDIHSTIITKGKTFEQIEVTFDSPEIVSVIIRLYHAIPSDTGFGDPYGSNIEIEWSVLPYDVPNKSGKNIVVRYRVVHIQG